MNGDKEKKAGEDQEGTREKVRRRKERDGWRKGGRRQNRVPKKERNRKEDGPGKSFFSAFKKDSESE